MESRKSIIHKGEGTPCLPEQVITEEILPRLPVKSLLKFRCVSKPWCSLIGSKRFIKAHLKRSIKSSWIAHHWIFLFFMRNEFIKCCLPTLFDNPFTVRISHISDLGIDESDVILPVGCCNGLVCILVNWKRFILWNPTTKKINNLPVFYDQIKVECGDIGKYGFGFDELSDDYKVFGTVNPVNARDSIGMVYSLKSNSWKHIEETHHVSPFNNEGMYVSGKLHWYNGRCDIVSFDLNKHVYGVVELPSYTKGFCHSLGAVWGGLSAHFRLPNGDLDVWLMKEYGVKESWDKVMTVPYNHNKLKNPFVYDYDIPAPVPYGYDISVPVAIAPNGEVFLINSSVMIYNPKLGVHRDPHITCGIYFGIYIESLASIASDAG